MDLTFQVPMQYCSLHNQTLLPLPVTSTTGHCFCFGCLFILSGVISLLFSTCISGTYWPGEFIFQCPIFLPFILSMGFSRQEYWNSFQVPPPVDRILSELSTNNTRRLYTWTNSDGWHQNQTDYILFRQRWRSSIQSAKTRTGADCGSNHELLIAKFDLNWRE